MKEFPFIGRETKLQRLNNLLKKKTASLVVIRGRRRIKNYACALKMLLLATVIISTPGKNILAVR